MRQSETTAGAPGKRGGSRPVPDGCITNAVAGPDLLLKNRPFRWSSSVYSLRSDRIGFDRLRCAGFGLVELLVVIAVISLLLAMAFPAIQASREASRNVECRSHLRQISLGCEAFITAHQHYPQGQLFGVHGVGADSRGWSWLARLLPYVGEQPLHQLGGIPYQTIRNSAATPVTIPLFLCPSDNFSAVPRYDAGNLSGVLVGQTNYKGVSGANWGADESQGLVDIQTDWRNRGTNGSYDGLNHGDGMLYRVDYRRPRRKRDVHDGTSHTFVIGEDLPEANLWCSWPYSNNAYGTCAIPPNYDPPNQRWAFTHSFRSRHPRGLNFAFADGSVRFIADDIFLDTYRALATIAGQEAVSIPSE